MPLTEFPHPLPTDPALAPRAAPPDRPLQGITLLLVEDSRLASEGMRLLCLRSGARLRRADSLLAAERHLRTYRPHVAIVDLGLPDGSGLDLIRRLDRASPRIDALLATSGDDSLEGAALAAGADAFLAKPLAGLGAFQMAILDRLPGGRGLSGPQAVPMDRLEPDVAALRDDLAHGADLLARGEPGERDYVAQFLAGVARAAGDAALEGLAAALGAACARGAEGAAEAQALAAALRQRMAPLPVI